MRLIVLGICAIAALPAAAPAQAGAPEVDGEVWLAGIASGGIKGPVQGNLEYSFRSMDKGTTAPTQLTRAALGMQISKPVSLWLGYGRVVQRPEGRPVFRENRLYQQLSWTIGKVGPGTLVSRTRLEERTVEGRTGTGWRLRQQLRYTIPIKNSTLSAVAHTEPFIALNSTNWGASAGIDQWRTFVGVSVPLTKGLSADVGYMNRYVRRLNQRDRIDHILPITVNYRF